MLAPQLAPVNPSVLVWARQDSGWVKTNSGMFVPTANLLADSLAVQNQFTGLRDPKAEYEEADPYVIALAQQKGGLAARFCPAAQVRVRFFERHAAMVLRPNQQRQLGDAGTPFR